MAAPLTNKAGKFCDPRHSYHYEYRSAVKQSAPCAYQRPKHPNYQYDEDLGPGGVWIDPSEAASNFPKPIVTASS